MCERTRSRAQVLHPILRCCVGRRAVATPDAHPRIACDTRALSRTRSRDCASKKSSAKCHSDHTAMRQRQCRGHRCVMEKWVLECANTTLEGKRTKGAKDKSAKHNKMTMHKIHRSRCASTGVGRTLCRYQEDWCGFNARQVWVCLCRSRRRQLQHNNVVWDSTTAKTTFKFTAGSTVFQSIGKSTAHSSCRQGSSTLVLVLQQSLNA